MKRIKPLLTCIAYMYDEGLFPVTLFMHQHRSITGKMFMPGTNPSTTVPSSASCLPSMKHTNAMGGRRCWQCQQPGCQYRNPLTSLYSCHCKILSPLGYHNTDFGRTFPTAVMSPTGGTFGSLTPCKQILELPHSLPRCRHYSCPFPKFHHYFCALPVPP